MNNFENIVIEVSTEKDMIKQLECLSASPLVTSAKDIHLLSVLNDQQRDFLPLNIETDEQIEEYVKSLHSDLRDKLSKNSDATVSSNMILRSDSKLEAVEYLKKVKADLVITATHGNMGVKGVYMNSFTEFLLMHSPCDVYVVRPIH